VARPSPEAVNIPILSVNGDSSFGPLIEYLDMFGIPWAAVVDGPALRPTSHLAKQMRKLDHQPSANQPNDDDFKGWQEYWAREGIFTLADRFGDDGSKGGEFEAFLRSTDSDRLCKIHKEIGQQSKPRVGALFAAERRRQTKSTSFIVTYGQDGICRWMRQFERQAAGRNERRQTTSQGCEPLTGRRSTALTHR
jgi:hypothetical protein